MGLSKDHKEKILQALKASWKRRIADKVKKRIRQVLEISWKRRRIKKQGLT